MFGFGIFGRSKFADKRTATATNNGAQGGGGSTGSPELFTTPGSGSWTVPAGITSVMVECWGGGGRGIGGSGGGGGAYSRVNALSVTPGASIAYFVAAGNGPSNTNSDPTYFGASTAATAPVRAATGTTRLAKETGNGGQAADGVGDVKYSGGDCVNPGNGANGGGGSASKNGNGNPSSGGAGGSSPGAGAGGAGGDPPSPGASNVEGGGGSGGATFSGFAVGGAPGGGSGSSGDSSTVSGGRGQIRLTYGAGGGAAPVARRRLSPTQ